MYVSHNISLWFGFGVAHFSSHKFLSCSVYVSYSVTIHTLHGAYFTLYKVICIIFISYPVTEYKENNTHTEYFLYFFQFMLLVSLCVCVVFFILFLPLHHKEHIFLLFSIHIRVQCTYVIFFHEFI